MSLAYSRRTAPSYSISNCKIPLVRLIVAGCATRSGPSSWGTRAAGALRLSWSYLPLELLPPCPRPPSGHFPSRNPPSCCPILPDLSFHSSPRHRAAANFPGGLFTNHCSVFVFFLGPFLPTYAEFHEQLAETVPTSLSSRSGQAPDMVAIPRCHTGTDVRQFPFLPHTQTLSLSFCSRPPIATIALWASITSVPVQPFRPSYCARDLCMHVPTPYRRSLRKTGIVPAVAPSL